MPDTSQPLSALMSPPRLRRGRATSEAYREIVEDHGGLAAAAPPGSPAARTLEAIFAGSPFLTALITRDPGGTADDLATDPRVTLAAIHARLDAEMDEAAGFRAAQSALRRARARAARLIGLIDVGEVWPVDDVIAALSETAETIVSAAVDWLLRDAAAMGAIILGEEFRPGAGSGYIVLGLGKLGGGELNYSSDIDLVVFFDRARARLAPGTEAQPVFVRVTRDLVRLLQERTADGYAFRTDLRLRPDPGATNVAISVAAAEQYYESLGQNWERAAMIKARPVAGDIEAGEAFLAELAPFIWRRYLDFAAIADVHSIKRQIQAYRGHARIAVAGHNIKLGRGGIREIEFFVQTQQLIAGGRQPALRGRRTLAMLAELHRIGWIDAGACEELTRAYRFLRRIENRLQMQADDQTHTLPREEDQLAVFARFAGYDDPASFAEALGRELRAVERHYAALFETAPGLGVDTGPLVFTGSDDDPETLETLQSLGFSDPALVSRTVRQWHFGRYNATRSAAARERLTELMPALVRALAESDNPDYALITLDRFIAQLPAGVQLFSLLRANPHLLSLLADVMGTSPRLARTLSLRPRTLEEAVLEPEFFSALPDEAEYARLAAEALGPSSDMEDALNRARTFGSEHLFRIGVRQLSATLSAEEAGAAYAGLASGLIRALIPLAERDLAARHGSVHGGEVVVVGMGKLASREMTATSDLDLILIYDTPAATTASDGARPLAVGKFYTRLTQRLISALTAPTAEGRLFEVDMRLRPSGRSGPVATQLASFRSYQLQSAWTWEKMALTRARIVAGDEALGARVAEVIGETLSGERDPASTARDVAEMRARIAAEKGSGDIWSLKFVRGGLIDIEFIAQYLQLVHAHDRPEVLRANTGEALAALATAGVLADGAAEELLAAWRLFHEITQMVRVSLGDPADPRNASQSFKRRLAKCAGAPDFSVLEAEIADAEAAVAARFDEIVVAGSRN